ncbi:Pimeloyl-ACP methyl ester carboxylesterase [Flexibacter flexilis DSM 6793]|uniref:Pimeloyl-ACP methyl ester carboxylesterase n=1 Tax=Flexibacter flexilis DSM 6793 TaxID=927664 RepID=A0A1I1NHZ8_9BACT|nr:alpha/beta hydrolase [Flexibacter flexilis]SFC97334.1 Pimeloyl-ACP methyl ester carboxylesterase [Flexibacter flexilis DSM 6793]
MLYFKKFELNATAPWVVFVHGAGGNSSIWFKQLKDYKQNFNVMLLDLRGHGKSKQILNNYSNYSFKDIAKEILDTLDSAQIQKAHFVGISLGTIIIRTIGELAPHRIESMVLGGAITRLNFRARFLSGAGNLFKNIVPYMWLYSLFAWIIMPKKRHKSSRTLFINEAKKLCQKEFLRWYRLTYEVNPLLRYFKEKELPIPTLYLMGEEDYMFLPPVKMIVDKHKHSELYVVSNSGHVCNVDQPEQFNQISINFIKRLSSEKAA